MTPRQLRFVKEYLREQNATRAMVRAGYSARTANNHCARLMGDPEIKRMIKAGLEDQEAAVRLASVNLLLARIDEARRDIVAARDEISAANRRVKQASATVRDIERLTAPARVATPDPLQPAGHTSAPASILPCSEPGVFRDWLAPDRPDAIIFAEGGRSDFETNP